MLFSKALFALDKNLQRIYVSSVMLLISFMAKLMSDAKFAEKLTVSLKLM